MIRILSVEEIEKLAEQECIKANGGLESWGHMASGDQQSQIEAYCDGYIRGRGDSIQFVITNLSDSVVKRQCEKCNGKGSVMFLPCSECHGMGFK